MVNLYLVLVTWKLFTSLSQSTWTRIKEIGVSPYSSSSYHWQQNRDVTPVQCIITQRKMFYISDGEGRSVESFSRAFGNTRDSRNKVCVNTESLHRVLGWNSFLHLYFRFFVNWLQQDFSLSLCVEIETKEDKNADFRTAEVPEWICFATLLVIWLSCNCLPAGNATFSLRSHLSFQKKKAHDYYLPTRTESGTVTKHQKRSFPGNMINNCNNSILNLVCVGP